MSSRQPRRCRRSRRPGSFLPMSGCWIRARPSTTGRQSVVVLAFENADHPVDAWMDRALAITQDFGGSFDPDVAKSGSGHRAGAAEAWRNAFIRMPHYQKTIVEMGIITDTFETAITWERFPTFYTAILSATDDACLKATGQKGSVERGEPLPGDRGLEGIGDDAH